MEHHETYGIISANTASPARNEMVIRIPQELRYPRLYGALWFFGGVITGRASAEITLETGNAGQVTGRYRWDWGFPGSLLEVGNSPFRLPGEGNRGAWCVPPFTVQKIQPGEDCQWMQAGPLGRDVMLAAIGDLDFPATFNVCMHPIPFISSAERIKCVIDAQWTTDGGTFPSQGCHLLVGCRSSVVPVQ